MRIALVLALAACSAPASRSPSNRAPGSTGKRVALAVVFNGWELAAGNDTLLEADDPARYDGMLPGIDNDVAKLTSIGDDGSLAALVVYADRALVSHALAPLRDVKPGWFGTQKTYFAKIGFELVAGIEVAANLLDQAPADLDRLVLVIGDGCDTNTETSTQRLVQLGLVKRHIALHHIQIVTKLSAECPALPDATHHGAALTSGIDHFVAAVRSKSARQ